MALGVAIAALTVPGSEIELASFACKPAGSANHLVFPLPHKFPAAFASSMHPRQDSAFFSLDRVVASQGACGFNRPAPDVFPDCGYDSSEMVAVVRERSPYLFLEPGSSCQTRSLVVRIESQEVAEFHRDAVRVPEVRIEQLPGVNRQRVENPAELNHSWVGLAASSSRFSEIEVESQDEFVPRCYSWKCYQLGGWCSGHRSPVPTLQHLCDIADHRCAHRLVRFYATPPPAAWCDLKPAEPGGALFRTFDRGSLGYRGL